MAANASIYPSDMHIYYQAMAESPDAFWDAPEIFAQRCFPSLIVWVLTSISSVDVASGFRILSILAFVSFVSMFYIGCRRSGLVDSMAFVATVFASISSWPVSYGLGNVYQACDTLAYPLSLGIILGLLRGNLAIVVIAATIGMGCRQQLVILAVVAMLEGYRQSRKRDWLIALVAYIGLAGAFFLVAGRGGVGEISRHTIQKLPHVMTLPAVLWDSRIPLLLSPYLFVFALSPLRTGELIRRYWWISVFALITTVQPLLAYDITGQSNAQRLAMIGLWPALWAGAMIVNDSLNTRCLRMVFYLMPIVYGTEHLVLQAASYHSPLGHRFAVNVLLGALLLFAHSGSQPHHERTEGSESREFGDG